MILINECDDINDCYKYNDVTECNDQINDEIKKAYRKLIYN